MNKISDKMLTHSYHPSQDLYVIGITGTNGKTTVSYLVNAVLLAANIKSSYLGTLNSTNTDLSTPEAVDIKNCMLKHLKNGGTHFVMEVTSEGIDQSRIKDVDFDIKLLTNISRDHLDYHKSLKSYRKTKLKFMSNGSGYKIYPNKFLKEEIDFPVKLLGNYNYLNIKAAVSILKVIGISNTVIKSTLSKIHPPPGRLESICIGQKFKIFIDYAHTPDAFRVVLNTLKEISTSQGGNLLILFGCGGNRDKGKRKLMGEISSEIADLIVLTDDNPRFEDSSKIIEDIRLGLQSDFTNYNIIQNRKMAIKHIVRYANDNDVVALLGKGHEKHQIYGEVKVYHDDKDTAAIETINYIQSVKKPVSTPAKTVPIFVS